MRRLVFCFALHAFFLYRGVSACFPQYHTPSAVPLVYRDFRGRAALTDCGLRILMDMVMIVVSAVVVVVVVGVVGGVVGVVVAMVLSCGRNLYTREEMEGDGAGGGIIMCLCKGGGGKERNWPHA